MSLNNYYRNPKRWNEQSRQRNNIYYEFNEQYRLKTVMRSSLRRWLNGRNKTSFLSQYIGCDLNTLKKWLQLTAFINGYYDFNIYDMTKDYHIDHKIPVTKFDLTKPEEIAKAYHYSNLQILSAVDNKRKYKKSDYENFDKVKNSLTVRIFKMFN